MAIIIEGYLNGRKVRYDLVKFQNALMETLAKKALLTKDEIETLYKKAQ